jgi:Tfp pilus assembly protein PilO
MNVATVRRVAQDYRGTLIAMAVLGVLAGGGYALVVAPLEGRLAAAEARAFAAAHELRAAAQQEEAARRTVTGKEQAARDLDRFYAEVLPADQTAARRVTYLHLAQMADEAGLRFERRTFAIDRVKNSQLARMSMTMLLRGAYGDIRTFIYDLESSSDFVVISGIRLVQRSEAEGALELALELATYFRAADGG